MGLQELSLHSYHRQSHPPAAAKTGTKSLPARTHPNGSPRGLQVLTLVQQGLTRTLYPVQRSRRGQSSMKHAIWARGSGAVTCISYQFQADEKTMLWGKLAV